MQNVTFENDDLPITRSFEEKKSPIAQFFTSKGILKTEGQVRFLFATIMIVCLALSAWLMLEGDHSSKFIRLPDGKEIPVADYIAGVKAGIYK